MRTISFEVTDNEYKVLCCQCADPQEWVENAVSAIIERAKDQLVQLEIQRILNDPNETTLTNDRETLVANYKGPLRGDPTK